MAGTKTSSNSGGSSSKNTTASTNAKTSGDTGNELPKTGESNQLSAELSILGFATVFGAGAFFHHLEKKKSL